MIESSNIHLIIVLGKTFGIKHPFWDIRRRTKYFINSRVWTNWWRKWIEQISKFH
jgi:hypothetical protein